ncbi:glycerate kinase [Thermoplasma volcanium GSS1]|uniref:Glycerate kinase n=1 Tax=Thermoplasma volcanium (strain ATCC 51530 / DSM 4299 / JCM 9571 / NBRC 15438 / GSS1) TaxID=273116 RepID=Q97AL3_THEVO|nr:glycerate 2-kinase [Thermoplasma volcanium]BAB59939.1 glycerate kinase [Thermoplasma volcanium GSS1]
MPFSVKNISDVAYDERRAFIFRTLNEVFKDFEPNKVTEKAVNEIDLNKYAGVYVIGFGKAAYEMYLGVREHVKRKLKYAGIIIPSDQEVQYLPELDILRGTHPLTSTLSVTSSKKLLSKARPSANDLVLVLISGGGSSLFEIPQEGITIDQMASISRAMMDHSANIYELNTIRSALSSVKGGKLARILYPATIIALIISDVPGDDISIIASGPLAENKLDPSAVYAKYRDIIPIDITKYVENSSIEDLYFRNVMNRIILSNRDFVFEIYKRINEPIVSFGSNIQGDVTEVSEAFVRSIYEISKIKGKSFWFVAGGETTVNVKGNGIGGRNLELALRFMKLANFSDFLFLSIGTDGIDGVSPAAGGIVSSDMKLKISSQELEETLDRNDAFTLLSAYHGAIMTGRTGNNVSDIMVGYVSLR